jgi:hypothetical protein
MLSNWLVDLPNKVAGEANQLEIEFIMGCRGKQVKLHKY